MANYYGVVWQYSNSLEHHGIKGQRWGVRRFQEEDGTLTAEGRKRYGVDEGGNKKFDRLYKREMKRLKKLKDRTDIDLQREKAAKYDRRAKIGAKVALAGAGIAVGARGVNQMLKENAHLKNQLLYRDADQLRRDADNWVHEAWRSDKDYSPSKGYSQKTKDLVDFIVKDWQENDAKVMDKIHKNTNEFNKGANIRKVVATGAAVVGTAGAATAAYSKIMSYVAKKRITDIGHEKAVKKYQEQYDRAMKTFGGTAYSNLLKKEIEEYKHDHPNSKLSNKEIAKNLR